MKVYKVEGGFDSVIHQMRVRFLELAKQGKVVDTGHWQALRDVPHTRTFEIQNAVVEMIIRPTKSSWAEFIRPNLPWAEDHFLERVGGEPLNPGEQYKNWPWYRGGVEDHKQQGHFSHSYMERFWPKWANGQKNEGVRFPYGGLDELLALLARDPQSRQAYLPIWFPEDLQASMDNERVPCSLGYHFLLRDNELHCFYPIRSCDFVRYLRDDAYMAGRMVQWLLDQLVDREGNDDKPVPADRTNNPWNAAVPGTLTMFIPSLHIFEGDIPKMRREHDEYVGRI